MTATLRFDILPSFSHIEFSDSADAKEAVDYILQIRKRKDDDEIVSILNKAGNVTVGDLRRLTDHDWNRLELPAICRIYLKNLVRQSARVSSAEEKVRWAQLEARFNNGAPFDMNIYQSKLKALEAMSFERVSAMEALLMAGNSVEGAVEILTKNGTRRGPPTKATPRGTPAGPSVEEQIAVLQKQWEREKAARQKAEDDLKAKVPKENYKGFLRGLIATEMITPIELEKLKRFREEINFGDREHIEALAELGYTQAQFDELKTGEMKREKECVVCLDKPKNHVMFDCMHLCLCEDCVPEFNEKRNKKCPICTKKVTNILRIYF